MEIELQDVAKRFSDSFILRHINFKFESGKIYGVKGPNGSGKSTLLKIICGHLSHSIGEISYRLPGKNIPRGDIAKHMIFSAPYIDLIEDYSMAESLDFHQQFRALDRFYNIEEFREVLNYPKIKKRQLIRFYSSGMKQRLQLCLTLLTQSDVLLLDEPTSYLDEDGVKWFHELLDRKRSKKTIIIASNEEKDFLHCDQVISIAPWMA